MHTPCRHQTRSVTDASMCIYTQGFRAKGQYDPTANTSESWASWMTDGSEGALHSVSFSYVAACCCLDRQAQFGGTPIAK